MSGEHAKALSFRSPMDDSGGGAVHGHTASQITPSHMEPSKLPAASSLGHQHEHSSLFKGATDLGMEGADLGISGVKFNMGGILQESVTDAFKALLQHAGMHDNMLHGGMRPVNAETIPTIPSGGFKEVTGHKLGMGPEQSR